MNMRNIHINYDELACDLVMMAGVLFLKPLLVPSGNTVLDILDPLSAMVLVCLILLFGAVYLGSFYRRLEPYQEDHPILAFFVPVILFFMMQAIFIAVPAVFLVDRGLFSKDGTHALLLFGLILGPAGFILGNSRIPEISTQAAAVKRAGGLRLAAVRIVLPVIVASLLLLWQEIMILTCIAKDAGNHITISPVLFNLVLGGVIPLRILVALVPPYRIVSTGVGLVSLAIYITALVSRLQAAGV
jgi:hypothetical protein